ncbi:MAG: phosphoadenylyl-sulfate reductase [Pseudomonadota bacterium]
MTHSRLAAPSPTPHSPAGSAIARYARAEPGFEARLATTQALLRQAADSGRAVQASSLGAEDMVLTDLINRLRLPIGIFVLDTGLLHPQTLALLQRLREQQAAHPHAPLTIYRPQQEAVVAFVEREGDEAMRRSVALRKACCALRKLEPLERALHGQAAWVTGLRREQSEARSEVSPIDTSERARHGRLKFNPLADWSWGDVWHYIERHGVAYNPLHDQHMPSIGCAPCTRAITAGEPFRAGRWWWEDDAAKECGLHVKPPIGEHP